VDVLYKMDGEAVFLDDENVVEVDQWLCSGSFR